MGCAGGGFWTQSVTVPSAIQDAWNFMNAEISVSNNFITVSEEKATALDPNVPAGRGMGNK